VQNRAGYTTCKVRVFVGPGDAYSDVTGGETSADTSSDTSEETKDQATLDDPLGTSSSGDTGTGTTKQNTDIVKDSGKSQTGALTYDGFISKYGSKEDLQNDPGAFKEDKDALKADPNAFQISNLQEDEAFDQLATQLGKDGVYSKEDIAQLEQAAREADARAKARKAGSVQDMNDLTPSEVKNLWNRPRESVTGGLTEDILPNDTETNSHSAGIMSRFTHWVKQTFCFWCQVEKVGLIDRGNMLAAAKKPLPASAKPSAQKKTPDELTGMCEGQNNKKSQETCKDDKSGGCAGRFKTYEHEESLMPIEVAVLSSDGTISKDPKLKRCISKKEMDEKYKGCSESCKSKGISVFGSEQGIKKGIKPCATVSGDGETAYAVCREEEKPEGVSDDCKKDKSKCTPEEKSKFKKIFLI
jgi:hypothetical protein